MPFPSSGLALALANQEAHQAQGNGADDTGGPVLVVGRAAGEHIDAAAEDAARSDQRTENNDRHRPFERRNDAVAARTPACHGSRLHGVGLAFKQTLIPEHLIGAGRQQFACIGMRRIDQGVPFQPCDN